MLKIRLQRVGAKGQPSYRIVAADARAPRDGASVEVVGFYDPMRDPPALKLEQERVLFWLGRGAQPTPAVARILAKAGAGKKKEEAE